jgi:multidrug efflux pump subunit AcrA (membrane-fusion protein)
MNSLERAAALALAAILPLVLTACDGGSPKASPEAEHAEGDGHDHGEEAEAMATGSDRVAIPAAVRSNLGITFVEVERRRIEQTLRVPGRFEYLPTARREYRTAVPGRVELLVEQFDRVEAGQPLYRLDSPAWREMQQQLADAEAEIERLDARLATFEPLLAAHQEHEDSLHESVAVWNERVEQLQSVREAGGGRVDELAQARASLASTRADLANVMEKKAELQADRQQTTADLRAARARVNYLLDAASAVVSRPRDELAETIDTPHGREPGWAAITEIEVTASEAGVVEMLGLTNGSWADEKTPVLTIVQPDRLRFRASGLQSDLGVLRDGLMARIVPPTPTAAGRAVPMTETRAGTISLGLAGDPNDRTIELFIVPDELKPWARPGVSAQLEIVTDATASPELAVPLAAVQRDGLTPVLFRRNPDNPDEAIRMDADLGLDDGRWVALLSGLRDGDEVVLDGAFQLMLATSGTIEKGGHFHPDGTFHQGEDE